MKNLFNNPKTIIAILAILFFVISFFPAGRSVIDLTDIKDYTDTAKFFAGEYAAKHRSAHSDLYGLILSPYVKLAGSFLLIKLSSAFFLLMLILSIYFISGKNKKTLLLAATIPIFWYFTPWISPIPIASLLILWAYYFVKKFNIENKIKHLVYSGILVGLAGAFWDTTLYLSLFFLIAFLYDKKLASSGIFIVSLTIGLAPRLILDQLVYNLAFYSILKHAFAVFAFTIYGGIYRGDFNSNYLAAIALFALFVPFYSFLLIKKQALTNSKKEIIFIILTTLFIIPNPQPRMLLIIMPLIILQLGGIIENKQLRRQLIMSITISLFVITPYIIQFNYEIGGGERFDNAIININNLEITPQSYKILESDLNKISDSYPNQIFLVGNKNDGYRQLAHLYWGDKIEEFVSIEDYNLFKENKTIIADKKISSNPGPNERRELWIEIGLSKNKNDNTDYESIKYAIGIGEPISLKEFKLVKQYDSLYLSEKIE